MLRTKTLRILLGTAWILSACLQTFTAGTPTSVPPTFSLPQPTPTLLVQGRPAAVVKMLIGQPSSEDRGRVVHLAFSPDGRTLVSQNDQGAISLWDAVTGQPGGTLIDKGNFALGLALSPDGRILASGTCTKHQSGIPGCDRYGIVLWDMATRQPLGQPLELSFGGPTTPSLLFSPDGKTLAAMQSGITGSGTVQLFDVATRQPLVSPLGDQEDFSSLAFSPDGKWMALGTIAGILLVWSPEAHHVLFHIAGQKGFVRSVAFSPDGKILASAVSGPVGVPHIQLWDVATQQPVGPPLTVQTAAGTPIGLVDLAFHPAGRLLAALDENGAMTLWEVAAGRQRGQAPTGQSAATSLTFSPDGTLASGSKDGTLTLWDIDSYRP